MATANEKDTIYIDIDDEITAIIDKLHDSKGKVVALVLPKRATVFQSIVNMKLLKRAADAEKKTPVLITSEAGLLPLAGISGVHVAKTLTSKPEVPLPPEAVASAESISEDGEEIEVPPDPKQSVGDLAGMSSDPKSSQKPKPPKDNVETVMLDAEDIPPEDETSKTPSEPPKHFGQTAAGTQQAKNKKLKIPNFGRFRMVMIVAALILILLIAAFIFASIVLPKATIDVKTNATNVNANLNLTASTRQSNLNMNTDTLPAKLVQVKKTYSANAVTTGQTNEGAKASGSVTMVAQYCGSTIPTSIAVYGPPSIPSGTGLTANGLTYITEGTTTFSNTPDPPQKGQSNNCVNYSATQATPIQAQSGGASSNTSGTFTDPQDQSITATGSASGGTDNIVQTVNQNDINNAKNKININSNGEEQALLNELKTDGYYPIKATYTSGTPNVTTSAPVGGVASTVTVTETVTYTMFGVHKSDLIKLIDSNVNGQINTNKQSILATGLNSASFNVTNSSPTNVQFTLSTVAIAGPELNITKIKQEVQGLKSGGVKSLLQSDPNVTGVSVHFSPFWISTVPKKNSRITIKVAKPTTTAKAGSNNGGL